MMREKLKNNDVELSVILHKHKNNISNSEKSAAYLYLASRLFKDGEKNIVQKMTLLRFLSDKLLKDIITDKSLSTEVIMRAEEEENFTKEISPSHYKNLSTEEEIEICTYGKMNDLYNSGTRRISLNIVTKYLTRTYGKEFQGEIMERFKLLSTKDIVAVVCAEGKMWEFIKTLNIKAWFKPMIIPTNSKFFVESKSFTIEKVDQNENEKMITIKEEEEEKKEVNWYIPPPGAAAKIHPSTAGKGKVNGTKEEIIGNLLIHVRQNYSNYDEKQITKRLQSISVDELKGIVTDSNGFNNFMADINKGVSVDQFGSGEYASNTAEAYELTITVTEEESISQAVKEAYNKIHTQVIGSEHFAAILPKNKKDDKLTSPEEYPHSKKINKNTLRESIIMSR